MSHGPQVANRPVFQIGDRPIIDGAFTDANEAPAAPSAVRVQTKSPNGTITVYNSPHAAIVLGTTTRFTFPSLALDRAGVWTIRMFGTATVEASDEIEIMVEPSAFPTP